MLQTSLGSHGLTKGPESSSQLGAPSTNLGGQHCYFCYILEGEKLWHMSVLWVIENDTLRGIFCEWVSPDLCGSWAWGALWQKPLPSSSSVDTTSTYCGGERGCNRRILIWLLSGAFPARCTVIPLPPCSLAILEYPGPSTCLRQSHLDRKGGLDVMCAGRWQKFHLTQPCASYRWKSACSDKLPKCVLPSSENQDKWLGWNNRVGTHKGASICWVWISCLKYSAETTLSLSINQHTPFLRSRWVRPKQNPARR